MRSNKILFIILGAVVLACLAMFLADALIVPQAQRAATYGILDKNQSALVIHNDTAEFYILSVNVKGDQTSKFTGVIKEGDNSVNAIPPGDYNLVVHYSDRYDFSNSSYIEWYVDGVKMMDFSVKKGRAAIFSLNGGDVKGLLYEPPDLDNNSGKINAD
jgi:hypothetical protein